MKNIRFAYAGLLLLLSLLWWMADPLLPAGYEYFALRTVAINYTGVIGIGVMSVGDRKSTRLNSSHSRASRMPSSA